MYIRLTAITFLLAFVFIQGCAHVPMASADKDLSSKKFAPPAPGNSGIYIYRNSSFGGALKKSVYINGSLIGETAPMSYFYIQVPSGTHTLSTESEFSNNDLQIAVEDGKNHFVRQYIKMGVLVGGANLDLVSSVEGKAGVLQCKLAALRPGFSIAASQPATAAAKASSAGGDGSVYEYYGIAEQEMIAGNYDKNLWARALVEAEGDETRRKAEYIKLRANQLYVEAGGDTTAANLEQGKNRGGDTPAIDISGTYLSAITSSSAQTLGGRHGDMILTITQTGDKIEAFDSKFQTRITGQIEGDVVEFFVEANKATGHYSVEGEWKLRPDGSGFEGKWISRSSYDGASGTWDLTFLE